jgi:hypothetical protein
MLPTFNNEFHLATHPIDEWEKMLRHTSKWRVSGEDCVYFGFASRTQYRKDSASDNAIDAILRWLKQIQETGSVVHRKGAGRVSTSHEYIDRIHEAFSRSPQKSTK